MEGLGGGVQGWEAGGSPGGERPSQPAPSWPTQSSPSGECRAGNSEVGGDSRDKWEALVFTGLRVGEQMYSQTVAHPHFLPISGSILYLGGGGGGTSVTSACVDTPSRTWTHPQTAIPSHSLCPGKGCNVWDTLT